MLGDICVSLYTQYKLSAQVQAAGETKLNKPVQICFFSLQLSPWTSSSRALYHERSQARGTKSRAAQKCILGQSVNVPLHRGGWWGSMLRTLQRHSYCSVRSLCAWSRYRQTRRESGRQVQRKPVEESHHWGIVDAAIVEFKGATYQSQNRSQTASHMPFTRSLAITGALCSYEQLHCVRPFARLMFQAHLSYIQYWFLGLLLASCSKFSCFSQIVLNEAFVPL